MAVQVEISITSKFMGTFKRKIQTINKGEPDYDMAWAFLDTKGVGSITYASMDKMMFVSMFKDVPEGEEPEDDATLKARYEDAFVNGHLFCFEPESKWHLELRRGQDLENEIPFFKMHNMGGHDVTKFNNELFEKNK